MKAMRPREIANCIGYFLKHGDLDGILSMFHPDCCLVFPRGASPRTGLDAVRKSFEMFVDQRPTLVSKVKGELILGGTALLTADWHIEDGDGNVLDHGSSTEVAKQNQDGSWVYYMDCPFGPPCVDTELPK